MIRPRLSPRSSNKDMAMSLVALVLFLAFLCTEVR